MTEIAASNGSALEAEVERLTVRVERERTARMEAEAIAERSLRELYQSNVELDRRVQERVAEIEQLAERAALAERVKGEILATVSHELRTPLMGVVGALDLLAAEHTDDARLQAAMSGAARLRQLVDELLTVVDVNSRTSANPVAVPLDRFIEDLADTWRVRAMSTGSLIVTSLEGFDQEAWFDADQTRTALNRVIDNALHHGGPGLVTITAAVDEEDLTFTVTDEGPGITPENLAKLAQPFEMVDRSSTRNGQGIGLGLAVTRGLIELQAGQLTIESEPGAGTTVTVVLPVHETREQPDPILTKS